MHSIMLARVCTPHRARGRSPAPLNAFRRDYTAFLGRVAPSSRRSGGWRRSGVAFVLRQPAIKQLLSHGVIIICSSPRRGRIGAGLGFWSVAPTAHGFNGPTQQFSNPTFRVGDARVGRSLQAQLARMSRGHPLATFRPRITDVTTCTPSATTIDRSTGALFESFPR